MSPLESQPDPTALERSDVVERIRREALRLFVAKGYEATSMRDIASAVGISPGNLTYHFRRKADLFRAVFEATYTRFVDELRTIVATPDTSARDRLRALMDRFCALAEVERDMLKVILRELMTNPEHFREFATLVRFGHPIVLLQAVHEAVAEGGLPPGVGIGLLPVIMGSLVLAPTMFAAIAPVDPDPAFTASIFGRARHDLYRLLGYEP